MDNAFSMDCEEISYPVLIIPKKCTTLETDCEMTDNVFIEVNISSPDTEGNDMIIYKGFCNVKLLVNDPNPEENTSSENNEFVENDLPVIISDSNQLPYNQSQVWIDPVRSPYVYNQYDTLESQEQYSICEETHETHSKHITVEHNTTFITQNVYNYKESIQYSSAEDFEHKKLRKQPETSQTNNDGFTLYGENEFECGVFLSQLPEEIMSQKETKDRKERKYIGIQSDNSALKQLMSTDVQSASKQRKTILFLGHDSESGQTIQKIAVNDPWLECMTNDDVGNEVEIAQYSYPDDPQKPIHSQKRYQCDKCKQLFAQISAFRQHMVGNHKSNKTKIYEDTRAIGEVGFMCGECGKTLKNQEKFEMHCKGHGDPELECNKCRKVFASKFTLRAHRKLHSRKYSCQYCEEAFANTTELKEHEGTSHSLFLCQYCDVTAYSFSDLLEHEKNHEAYKESSEEFSDGSDIISFPEEDLKKEPDQDEEEKHSETVKEANSVIAQVVSDKIFTMHTKKAGKHRKYRFNKGSVPKWLRRNPYGDTQSVLSQLIISGTTSAVDLKFGIVLDDAFPAILQTCQVCKKKFDRIGDLKRHLIEHIIRSTLAKTPVNKNGTLNILCEVCQTETFSKVDRYKAHLREHAKLTLYQCIFCDKSFSDSSNFSKHKKIHGATYFQCDLCQRKFNSKKMITQHMEYHNEHAPIPCKYCGKMFHFQSMLNKHIKCAHTKELSARFRCKFCHTYFKALKEKWEHEWNVHSVRKMIVDCLVCCSKFRKYSELKKHCADEHNLMIPPAKNLLRKRKSTMAC